MAAAGSPSVCELEEREHCLGEVSLEPKPALPGEVSGGSQAGGGAAFQRNADLTSCPAAHSIPTHLRAAFLPQRLHLKHSGPNALCSLIQGGRAWESRFCTL